MGGVRKSFDVNRWFKLVDHYATKATSRSDRTHGVTEVVDIERPGQLFNCIKDLLVFEDSVAESQAGLKLDLAALQTMLGRHEACVQRLWYLILTKVPTEPHASAITSQPHMSLAVCLAISAVFLIDMALDTSVIATSQRSWLASALRDNVPRAEDHLSGKFRMWLLYLAQERPQMSKDAKLWFRFIFLTETKAMGLNSR